ncbi:hypothetical protein [Candidatus Poriferisodalis sp.]|uniref:hypothetical protein n=1 Tax=Candidatus Poriferisodalis sp. TaxID=3101277 RepID=UPI003B016050
MTDELEQFPSPRIRDHARAGVQAAVSALPLGGTVNQLFDAVMSPSIERRQTRWFKQLAEIVEELKDKVDDFDLEQLADNEVFVTAVLDASRIAVTTHREEKLALLRSVLLRLATESASDEFLALQMLRFVDELEPEHFMVLKYCADPSGWYDTNGIDRSHRAAGPLRSVMNGAGLPVTGAGLEIVRSDLSELGLVNLDGFNVTVFGDSMWRPLATELGMSLLEFVMQSDED